MRLTLYQLPVETFGNQSDMQLKAVLFEMSLLPTSSLKKSCRRGHDDEEEDHEQQWTFAAEKQGRECTESELCQGRDEDEEEAEAIEGVVPEVDNSATPPPFCNNRLGVGFRSSRGIPFMTQSPHQRHPYQRHPYQRHPQPQTHSPASASHPLQNQSQALHLQGEQYEQQAKRPADASSSLNGVPSRNDGAPEEPKDYETTGSFPVTRNLPPKKRVLDLDGTAQQCRASRSWSLWSEDSIRRHETRGHYAAKVNFENEHCAVRCSPDSSPTATPRKKGKLEGKNSSENRNLNKAACSSASSEVDGSGLPHLGPSSSSVAVPHIALQTGPDSPQHDSVSSEFGAGSTPGLAPAGSVQSATPARGESTLCPSGAKATQTSFLPVNSIASVSGANAMLATTRTIATAYQQLAESDRLGGSSSWIHSVLDPSSAQMHLARTMIPSATKNNDIQHPQSIIADSSLRTNTDPVGRNRPGASAELVTAHQPLLKHDEHCIIVPLSCPNAGQSFHLGTTGAATTLNRTPSMIKIVKQPGQQQHDRHAPDGSRDDPDVHDYLVGQGGHGVHHIGNKRVRDLIKSLMPQFRAASKLQSSSAPHTESARSKLIRDVIQDVHSHGGTFLKRDATGTKWVPVPDREIVRKITQRFNEEKCGPRKKKDKKSKSS